MTLETRQACNAYTSVRNRARAHQGNRHGLTRDRAGARPGEGFGGAADTGDTPADRVGDFGHRRCDRLCALARCVDALSLCSKCPTRAQRTSRRSRRSMALRRGWGEMRATGPHFRIVAYPDDSTSQLHRGAGSHECSKRQRSKTSPGRRLHQPSCQLDHQVDLAAVGKHRACVAPSKACCSVRAPMRTTPALQEPPPRHPFHL